MTPLEKALTKFYESEANFYNRDLMMWIITEVRKEEKGKFFRLLFIAAKRTLESLGGKK